MYMGGGLKRGASEVRKNGGPGAFYTTTPFSSLENTPFLDDLPSKKATDHK